MNLIFVTGNKNKFKEAQNILDNINLTQIDKDIEEVQNIHAIEVAKRKAEKCISRVNCPFIIDDTALYIKAWNGFPGALAKFMIKELSTRKIFELLQNDKKYAVSETVIGYYDGDQIRLFTSRTNGKITKPTVKGHGFDDIFLPDNSSKTFAEMSIEEKKEFSPRYKALKLLKAHLEREKR